MLKKIYLRIVAWGIIRVYNDTNYSIYDLAYYQVM